MDEPPSEASRRRMLRLAGTAPVVGLAGCLGTEEEEDDSQSERPEDWCLDELDDTVPEELETAESGDGVERDPDEVRSKEEVAYQCSPRGFQLCANCRLFIRGGEFGTAGACTDVEGEIASQHWCAIYEPADRLDEEPEIDPLGQE